MDVSEYKRIFFDIGLPCETHMNNNSAKLPDAIEQKPQVQNKRDPDYVSYFLNMKPSYAKGGWGNLRW